MEYNYCNTCKNTKEEFTIEEMLEHLDEIVSKIKSLHKTNLDSLFDLEIAISAVHREFEEKVNKFCQDKG